MYENAKINMKIISKFPLLNYLGQLRLYSLIDMILLFFALKATLTEIIGATLLWIGFLIFLESLHKDRDRLRWPRFCWVIPWIIGYLVFMKWEVLFLMFFSVLYMLKKVFPFGLVSPILSGLIKTFLAYIIIGFSQYHLLIILLLMSIRNLAGDFRDAKKDSIENVFTIPVALGFDKNMSYIYPSALLLTTTVWMIWAGLSLWFLPLIFMIEMSTYNLTPR